MIASKVRTNGNGSRNRRFSTDAARVRWYAAYRAYRFRRHYFGMEIPGVIVIAVAAAMRHP